MARSARTVLFVASLGFLMPLALPVFADCRPMNQAVTPQVVFSGIRCDLGYGTRTAYSYQGVYTRIGEKRTEAIRSAAHGGTASPGPEGRELRVALDR